MHPIAKATKELEQFIDSEIARVKQEDVEMRHILTLVDGDTSILKVSIQKLMHMVNLARIALDTMPANHPQQSVKQQAEDTYDEFWGLIYQASYYNEPENKGNNVGTETDYGVMANL